MRQYKQGNKKDTPKDKKKRRAMIKDGHAKMITHGLPLIVGFILVLLGFMKYVTSK